MAEASVDRISMALIDASLDKDMAIQDQMMKATCELGRKHPEKVLSMYRNYLTKNSKLSLAHRVAVLQTMECVVREKIPDLHQSSAKMVIALASDEMTRSKEVVPEWQGAASNILVAVGTRFINEVMEEILMKFQPGILPHYYSVQTLANLSCANVYGMVPFLTAILGTMLPMLGMAKQDNMKLVFSTALLCFSESILEYLANLDKAPDPTVRRDTFATEMFAAYDTLFNVWLQNREPKVRLFVVEALGPMSHLLPQEKLEEQLPRLIPGILSLYKKHSEAFLVTKGLCPVLEAAVAMGSRSLETLLDVLLSTLHPQVCVQIDYLNQQTLRNHNEVLRCYTVLVRAFPDRLIGFLLQKLESSNERVRMGTLTALRHLINSAASQLESRKPLILSGLKPCLHENSNKVKRLIVQVISAMAHHGYLELEGGDFLLEYIVRHCGVGADTSSKRLSSDPEEITDEALRGMCENTLHLLTTTVTRMTLVLWPKLFEFVVPGRYASALAPVCKNLAVLGAKLKQDEERRYFINFNAHVNLPRPQALFTRLLVVSSFPFRGRRRGIPALHLLQVLGPNIHSSACGFWDEQIPLLVKHLEEVGESFNQDHWHQRLLGFLSTSLETISDEQWTVHLGTEMTRHLAGYNSCPPEKGFLYKCVGVCLQRSCSKEVVKKRLQEILMGARFHEEAEREGLAMAVGFCAASHLDGTLAKLEEFGKSDVVKKSSGLFSILKDRSDVDVDKVRSALILCYGYATLYAPRELILTRIDRDIIRNVVGSFSTKVLGIKVETKDLTLKLSLIKSVALIAKGIYNSAKGQAFLFVRKHDLLGYMLDLIKNEPPDNLRTAIRQNAIGACAQLVKLDPLLSESENFDLINTCVNSVFRLPPPMPETGKEESGLDTAVKENLYNETIISLQNLVKSILLRDLTPRGLQAVFKHVEAMITSSRDYERQRAVSTASILMEFYLEQLNVANMVSFHNLGALIGRLVPRCSDPVLDVRQRTVDCLYSLFYIQLHYEGFAPDYRDEMVENLQTLRTELAVPDNAVFFRVCCDLANVISKRLPQDQLTPLLYLLFEALVDPQTHCARAACVIVNNLVKTRGGRLHEQVPGILEVISLRLQLVSDESVRSAATQTISLLATHHLDLVVSNLLTYPLPFDSHVSQMWRSLTLENTLMARLLENLLERLNKHLPFETKDSFLRGSGAKIATFMPLAVTCALQEALWNPETGSIVRGMYPKLFSTLLVRLSVSVGVQPPREQPSNSKQAKDKKTFNPTRLPKTFSVSSCAVQTLQVMLERGGNGELVKQVEEAGGWELMKSEEKHHEGVSLLSRAMVKSAAPRLPVIVEHLVPVLSNIIEKERITVTAFLAELLSNHITLELMLLDTLMNCMMGRLVDSCSIVRMLAIRGLGNLAVGCPEKVSKHVTQLLAALTAGMDDKEDPQNLITLEAMSSLSKVLRQVEEKDIHSILIHLSLRIRPFFENQNDPVRAAAFTLFGNLSRFGEGQSMPVVREQLHNTFVSLLLHLNDPSTEVVKACKFALRESAPLLGSEVVRDMFQKHLREEKGLHYGEFMNDLSKHVISDFPDKLNFFIIATLSFYNSPWTEIRANAAMFIGFLVVNLPEDFSENLDVEHLCEFCSFLY
ncbi:maestro heat-like repeat-containing protein family member 1 isoform X3 [Latimeria chalumnae]|uniref:maestro heat-like repeat-containing protein family member 1 isoform X3 n=1 Tax=Latimeria chalumnae TaxID=7897 RepID=UPI00313DF1CC